MAPPQSFFMFCFTADFATKLTVPSTFVEDHSLEVKIEEVDDDGYFFTDGWSEFCGDMGLEVLELLLFSYNGNGIFDFSVYAVSALEKASDLLDSDNPRFRVEHFKVYHYSKFHVPSAFAKESGLNGKKKVLFEYSPGGQSHEVKLNPYNDRIALGAGCTQFCKGNNLKYGKSYVFEFIRMRNVIHRLYFFLFPSLNTRFELKN